LPIKLLHSLYYIDCGGHKVYNRKQGPRRVFEDVHLFERIMEPFTTAITLIAVAIGKQLIEKAPEALVSGVVGNRADAVLVAATRNVVKRLQQLELGNLPVNHDIQRVAYKAYILATLTTCEQCLPRLSKKREMLQALSPIGFGHLESAEVHWLKTLRRALHEKYRQLQDRTYIPPAISLAAFQNIELMLAGDLPNVAERIEQFKVLARNELMENIRSYGEPPASFITLVQREEMRDGDEPGGPGWFSLLCAFFLAEYKESQEAQAAVEGHLLVELPIKVDELQHQLQVLGGEANQRLTSIEDHLGMVRQEQTQGFQAVLGELRPALLALDGVTQQQQEVLILVRQISQILTQHQPQTDTATPPTADNILTRNVTAPARDIPTVQSKRLALQQQSTRLHRLLEEASAYGEVLPVQLQNALEDTENTIVTLRTQIREQIVNELSRLPRRAYSQFIGRNTEIQTLLSALTHTEAYPIVAIDGIGGTGKTALAREVASRALSSNTFYAVVWETAKPADFTGTGIEMVQHSEVDIDNLLDLIGRKLGHYEVGGQRSTPAKRDLIKGILNEERYLVVIDNLETIQGYRELIGWLEGLFDNSKALLTTRQKVSEFSFVRSLSLGGLEPGESVQFLRSWAKERGEAAEIIANANDKDLLRIHSAVGGLPLALELVAGQMTRASLPTVLIRLHEVNYQKLADPKSDDVYNRFFRFIYAESWSQLSDRAKELLISLGSFDLNEGADAEELAAVSALPANQLDDAAAELSQFSLIRRTLKLDHLTYSLHPLTHRFVQGDLLGA
jgi:hypothetical protein